ncbi:MAG: MFS transporter [Anaerolineaceae bacterium]
MEKSKLRVGQLLLLVVPAAFLELLNQIYNLYVPIFIQAGGAEFSVGGTLTLGFGFGALVVGVWMIADNLWGFAVQTFVGAWSDRTKNKRGRRIPFVIGTLPFIVVGYFMIPYIPTLIPPESSGQPSRLIAFIAFFTLACIIYYIGYTPVRLIFQAMRQEAVETTNRVKVESWYNFILNVMTIIAYTAGAMLYRVYGPLLFWIILVGYIVATLILISRYKESSELTQAADEQEKTNVKQIKGIFTNASKSEQRNLIWFLISVLFFTIAGSAYTNFASSWTVNVLGVDESKSSIALSLITIATTIAVLPAGYIAAGKFGRRNTYIVGLIVMILGGLVLGLAPQMYLIGFILLGVGMGIGFPSQLPLATEIAPQNGKMGSIISVYNIAYLTGFISGSFLAGWIIQVTSYGSLFYATSTAMTLSLIFFLFVKMPKKEATGVPQPQLAETGE